MSEEEKLAKRMSFLQDVLHKYTTTEPILDSQTLAMVITGEIGLDLVPEFIKICKKEDKKW